MLPKLLAMKKKKNIVYSIRFFKEIDRDKFFQVPEDCLRDLFTNPYAR